VKEKKREKSTTNKKKSKLLTIPNKLIMQSQTQFKIITINQAWKEQGPTNDSHIH